MSSWSFRILDIPLKQTWKIHHGSANFKPVGIVSFKKDGFEGQGEVAEATGSDLMRTYQKQFKTIQLPEAICDVAAFVAKLNVSNPLKVGVEAAWRRWACAKEAKSFYECLGCVPPTKVKTSYSVPIMPVTEVKDYIQKFQLQRFSSLKVKVGGAKDLELVKEVGRCFKGQLRIDANEAFESVIQVLQFLENLKDLQLEFLEQPLPRNAVLESIELKKKSSVPIVGDESLQGEDVTVAFANQFHCVNIKVMKAGGLTKAYDQIQQARKLDLKVMLGCMVETSLGVSTAFALGEGIDWYDLDGFLLLKEDPFQLIKESNGELSLRNP